MRITFDSAFSIHQRLIYFAPWNFDYYFNEKYRRISANFISMLEDKVSRFSSFFIFHVNEAWVFHNEASLLNVYIYIYVHNTWYYAFTSNYVTVYTSCDIRRVHGDTVPREPNVVPFAVLLLLSTNYRRGTIKPMLPYIF